MLQADKAEAEFKLAADLLEQLTQEYPEVRDFAVRLAAIYGNSGRLATACGKHAAAVECYGRLIPRPGFSRSKGVWTG